MAGCPVLAFTSEIFPRGYYEFVSTIIFRPERGTYRQSQYGSNHYEDYVETAGATGIVPEMLQTEMDLLRAEAALEMGDIPEAVSLVNQTRVNHGGLPAVVDGGTVPGGADCVPRKRFDLTGTCGDLRDALPWEHYNEIFQVSSGLTFFFTRRQGELTAGTALHSPIPAAELEVLQENIYTFGGDPGALGSAGQPMLSAGLRVDGDIERRKPSLRWRLLSYRSGGSRRRSRRPPTCYLGRVSTSSSIGAMRSSSVSRSAKLRLRHQEPEHGEVSPSADD